MDNKCLEDRINRQTDPYARYMSKIYIIYLYLKCMPKYKP